MYELNYAPEKLSQWNDYFAKYSEAKDIKYYNEFLCCYEPTLNKIVRKFLRKFELDISRLDDLKQIFAQVVWEELNKERTDIPDLLSIGNVVMDEWHEYVRLNCGNFQMPNAHQYAILRRVAWLYYQKVDGKRTLSQIAEEIANRLKMEPNDVIFYIEAAATFKPKYNAEFYGSDDDDEQYQSAVFRVADNLTTEDWFFILQKKEKIQSILAKMKKTDRVLIGAKYNICKECFYDVEKEPLSIVALKLNLTTSGAEKKQKKSIKKFKEELIKQGLWKL